MGHRRWRPRGASHRPVARRGKGRPPVFCRTPAEITTTLGLDCLRRYLQGLPATERTDFERV